MSALSGISGWGVAWLALGAGAAITLIGIGLAAAGIAIGHFLARLMDTGDGQGGVPPLPVTRALPLGELVISPEQERYAAYLAGRAAIDPDPALGCPCCPGARSNDCSCAVPCGDPSCQAIDPAAGCAWCTVPYTWPCTCAVQCGDLACVAGVRLA